MASQVNQFTIVSECAKFYTGHALVDKAMNLNNPNAKPGLKSVIRQQTEIMNIQSGTIFKMYERITLLEKEAAECQK